MSAWDEVIADVNGGRARFVASYVRGTMGLEGQATPLAPGESPGEGVVGRVVQDMAARRAFGEEKYGMALAFDDPRLKAKDWLREAYEEALDQVVYLRCAIDARLASDNVLSKVNTPPGASGTDNIATPENTSAASCARPTGSVT